MLNNFHSHDNFVTEIKHLLPLKSDENPSILFTFSKSLVKGDPLVMHYAFLLQLRITLMRNKCTYLDFEQWLNLLVGKYNLSSLSSYY